MEMGRPDPEKILESMEMEEEKKKQGRLRIFFGYAAGVGKTYSMLKSARKRKEEGWVVVIGYLEPHARPETMALADGLEKIPVKEINYNGISLKEMDVDEILLRKPGLVLVDEYAHTNAAGSRHEKRYQDVEEILAAGIDVYTTVNVQHIESLCDIVASITGIIVRERIPDHAFDRADEVKLVDIEPQVLITRLEEGKIYRSEQATRALDHFFTIEKLTALREIALRRTADRVNLVTERTKKQAGRQYYTEEKILVGISPSPSNSKIIRAAARMAQAFGGTMIGLYVETPDSEKFCDEDKKRLKDNIHLAEQLGAKIETVSGEDIPFLVAEYARNSGISKIVAGRSMPGRGFMHKPTFVDKLTMYAPDMDIYIIPDNHMERVKQRLNFEAKGRIRWVDFLKAALCLFVSTMIGFLFYKMGFSDTNIITVYILGVMISAIITQSRFLSFVQSFLSILVFNYCFTEPRFSLDTYNSGYPITFLITFVAALITGNLALKMRMQSKELAKSAYRTKVILDIDQMLQSQNSVSDIGATMAEELSKLLKRPIVYYQKMEDGLMEPKIYDTDSTLTSDEKRKILMDNEKAVAQWVFKNNKRAGATTGTLANAACYYLAVRSLNEVYGVVGIRINQEENLSAFESNVLMAVLSETATVMEREFLRKREEKANELANSEKLRANLLRSISHDLRTPLTSICGNADMLLQDKLGEEKRKQVCSYIYDDSVWLINLVENLLSVTRIEDGTMNIKKQAELLEDIIEEALKHVSRKSSEYHIEVQMEDEMQLVKVDSRLVLQVIINIVDNAMKYTPSGGTICISTKREGANVHIGIADNGIGISDDKKPYIFDMFYTANETIADSKRSLGLGLALCKSIISAHGGTIKVLDNKPKGTVFDFTLPVEEVHIHE